MPATTRPRWSRSAAWAWRGSGRLYEEGTYYISALIMAGEIIREATELLIPRIAVTRSSTGGGKMVIATVRGDIHDIGKNIVIALLDADGFTMVDLGVNVAPEQIAEAVERERPDVLGLSCLLTSGYEALRETIDIVRGQSATWHPHLPVVLGGAAVDEMVNERLGADGWCDDAARGLGSVRSLLRKTGPPRPSPASAGHTTNDGGGPSGPPRRRRHSRARVDGPSSAAQIFAPYFLPASIMAFTHSGLAASMTIPEPRMNPPSPATSSMSWRT